MFGSSLCRRSVLLFCNIANVYGLKVGDEGIVRELPPPFSRLVAYVILQLSCQDIEKKSQVT